MTQCPIRSAQKEFISLKIKPQQNRQTSWARLIIGRTGATFHQAGPHRIWSMPASEHWHKLVSCHKNWQFLLKPVVTQTTIIYSHSTLKVRIITSRISYTTLHKRRAFSRRGILTKTCFSRMHRINNNAFKVVNQWDL